MLQASVIFFIIGKHFYLCFDSEFMDIFLARDNQQAGPYDLGELNTMLSDGQVILTDLAWHTGLPKWQPLGELTAGQLHYTGTPAEAGHVPPQDEWQTHHATSMLTTISSTASGNPYITPQATLSQSEGNARSQEQTLAPIGKRLSAVLIDQLLFVLLFLPALPYLQAPKGGMASLDTQEKAFAFYEKTLQSMPPTVQGFISIGMLCLIVLQVFLLIKRGQSVGKLLMGIRIVDARTLKVPSITNVFLLRTLLTNIAYNIQPVGMFIFLADAISLFVAKENRTLHDKLAQTKVLVAQDKQLEKDII